MPCNDTTYESPDRSSIQNKENVVKDQTEMLKPLEIKSEVNGGHTPQPQLPSPTVMNHPNIYLTYGKFVPDTTEVKKQDVFIKKEYLPAPPKILKIEKTREDVTRTLTFTSSNSSSTSTNGTNTVTTNGTITGETSTNILIKHETPNKEDSQIEIKEEIKTEKIELVQPESPMAPPSSSSISAHNSSHKDKQHQSSSSNSTTSVNNNDKMTENNHSNSNSNSDKKDRDKSRSSSSHHKSSSSSHRNSSHSSSSSRKDCSRCYKRSKIKRANIGIQCRRDKAASELAPFNYTPMLMTPTRIPTVNRDFNCTTKGLDGLKYGRFFRIEVHPNGGASLVHLYQDEINSLPPHEMDELVDEFFKVVFSEDKNGYAHHIMGIVHDAASYMPDLLEHMAENYANLTVKAGVLGRNNDIETCTMQEYNEHVIKNYSEGTIRYGPLHQISLVGKVHEEVGGYFPDLIARLESNPFLHQVKIKSLFNYY